MADQVLVDDSVSTAMLIVMRELSPPERVAETMVRVGRRWKPDRIDLIEVGGESALRFSRDGQVFSVDTIGLRDGRIIAYRREMNPDKLTRVG